MARYDYVEKAVQVTRREFLAAAGVGAALLWTGAYVATDVIQDRNKYIKMRTQGLYKDDQKAKVRQSHNNKSLSEMYAKMNMKPLDEMAEHLFHTGRYVDRSKLV
jgi:ferredoxin hydrogenase small subunit